MDLPTVNTYNLASDQYQQDVVAFWAKFPKKILKAFRDSLKTNRVLSLGSGPGLDALLLKDMFLRVTCLDASSAMVEKTKALGFPSLQADLLDIPFKDSSFAGVWAYTSLLHIPKSQIQQAIGEIARILKPGGVVMLGMIEGDSQEIKPYSQDIQSDRLFVYYTEDELKELLITSGFKILSVDRYIPHKRTYLNILAKKL